MLLRIAMIQCGFVGFNLWMVEILLLVCLTSLSCVYPFHNFWMFLSSCVLSNDCC